MPTRYAHPFSSKPRQRTVTRIWPTFPTAFCPVTSIKKTATSILAEGANVFGAVKEIDPAKRTMTVTIRQGRGDDAGEDRLLAIAKEATVLIDDGKGRRLSLKEGKLADIPVGAMIMARLGARQPRPKR